NIHSVHRSLADGGAGGSAGQLELAGLDSRSRQVNIVHSQLQGAGDRDLAAAHGGNSGDIHVSGADSTVKGIARHAAGQLAGNTQRTGDLEGARAGDGEVTIDNHGALHIYLVRIS